MDFVYVGLILVCLGATWGLVELCEWLMPRNSDEKERSTK